MNVRPGGEWRYIQKSSEGNIFAFYGIYQEVDPPIQLSYTFNFEPMPGHEHLETLTLEEQDGKTKSTNRVLFKTVEDRDGMVETGLKTGSVETMDRLAELLEQIQKKGASPSETGSLLISWLFDAPVEVVWKAWTEPEQIMRWWGPKVFTAPVVKVDFRVGGKYLMAMRSPDGQDFWSTGTYAEIVPFKRIVLVDSFSDKDGNVVPATYYGMGADFPVEMQAILTFEAVDGKTKFTIEYPDIGNVKRNDLEAMTQGWTESLEKLMQLVRKT
jgi:uncharacterized protein YndB with AHSA1/START domain